MRFLDALELEVKMIRGGSGAALRRQRRARNREVAGAIGGGLLAGGLLSGPWAGMHAANHLIGAVVSPSKRKARADSLRGATRHVLGAINPGLGAFRAGASALRRNRAIKYLKSRVGRSYL